MLQLAGSGDSLRVHAAGLRQFPPLSEQDPEARRELCINSVREMLRTGGFHGRKAVVAISSRHLGIKNIRLPQMPLDKLDKAVRWEADERFGFEVKSDHLKYFSAGIVRQGAESRNELIMIATSEEAVNEYLAMFGAMGLRVEHIYAEPVALFNCFQRQLPLDEDENAASVIVDIGRWATRVVVGRGENIVFIKSIPIAGARFTEDIATGLQVSFEEAFELRRRRGGERSAEQCTDSPQNDEDQKRDSVAWTIRDVLKTAVDELAKEISLCLRYCSVTFRGLRPTMVMLCGGEAYDSVVTELVSERLGVSCELLQPLRGIDVSGMDIVDDRSNLSQWPVCAGMALMSADTQERGSSNAQDRLSA